LQKYLKRKSQEKRRGMGKKVVGQEKNTWWWESHETGGRAGYLLVLVGKGKLPQK
jgi:hypothetical protein